MHKKWGFSCLCIKLNSLMYKIYALDSHTCVDWLLVSWIIWMINLKWIISMTMIKLANVVTRNNLEWMMLIELIRIDNLKHTLIWINRLKVSKFYWYRGGIKKSMELIWGKCGKGWSKKIGRKNFIIPM